MSGVKGRKHLSEPEREQKRKFEAELKKYSVDCLKQIYYISQKALDMSVRLKANQYILDKCIGKNYQLYKDEEQTDKETVVNINLIPQGEVYELTEQDEQDIWNAENMQDIIDEQDDIEEKWGADDYYLG